MFDGSIATVSISAGHDSEAEVQVVYRWYDPSDDPWTKVKGRPLLIPPSGTWKFGAGSPPGVDLILFTKAGKAMTLWGFDSFDRLKVGLSGNGSFVAKGCGIPEMTVIEWRVRAVRK